MPLFWASDAQPRAYQKEVRHDTQSNEIKCAFSILLCSDISTIQKYKNSQYISI